MPRHLRHRDRFAVAVRARTPRAADHRDPSAGADTTPTDQLAVELERDQRRPHRDAAGVALGAVDGIDDPATPAAVAARSPNSSPRIASSGRSRREPLPDHHLDRPVGLGHRREVGLGLDDQVAGPEPFAA